MLNTVEYKNYLKMNEATARQPNKQQTTNNKQQQTINTWYIENIDFEQHNHLKSSTLVITHCCPRKHNIDRP